MNALRGESVFTAASVRMGPPELIVKNRISGFLFAKEGIRKVPMYLFGTYGTKGSAIYSKDARSSMDANSLQTNVRYFLRYPHS